MKKNEYAPYVIVIYIIIVFILFSLFGCNSYYAGKGYSTCPTNDKTFFYKRMGIKTNKKIIKYIN